MSDRNYWERHARRYDASVWRVFGRPLPRMLDLVRESVRGSERVLEVAAGTGIVTSAMAPICGRVVATDYAEAMVEVLGRRMYDDGHENVQCERADVYSLPYADHQFDTVVAANVLHLVPDFPAAIDALRRVTKPGGLFVAPTYCHDQTMTSWWASRVFAVTGFPSHRRFTLDSLRGVLEDNDVRVVRAEALAGLIPIGFVAGLFS